jgi:hypothetical protein
LLSVAFALARVFDSQSSTSSSSYNNFGKPEKPSFPSSVYRARQVIGLAGYRRTYESDPFDKYVLCRKCSSIWKKENILEQCRLRNNYTCPNIVKSVKQPTASCIAREAQCQRQRIPKPKRDQVLDYDIVNTACEWQLFNRHSVCTMADITDADGDASRLKLRYTPNAVFPYFSVIHALHQILLREGAEQLLQNHWRDRKASREKYKSSMMDIYDGRMWDAYQFGYVRDDHFESYQNGEFEHWFENGSKTRIYTEHEINNEEKTEKHRYRRVPLLNETNMIALALHEDGVSPNSRNTYSVGVLFFAILNLPREIRYRPENLLKVSFLPSMINSKEKSKRLANMHTLLEPIVIDLLKLFHPSGYQFPSTYDYPSTGARYRVMVLMGICDIPATRDVAGFGHHAATCGCNKCNIHFIKRNVDGKSKDDVNDDDDKKYTTFYATECGPLRTNTQHRHDGRRYKTQIDCNNFSAAEKIKKETGSTYTSLFRLPYFNCVSMMVLDALHLLFLGLAKSFMKHLLESPTRFENGVWKAQIDDTRLIKMESLMKKMKTPSDLGAIPRKIGSKFSSITGDEFKLFTLYYSLPLFKAVGVHIVYIRAWTQFVQACWILCARTITREQIDVAVYHIKRFCHIISTATTEYDVENKFRCRFGSVMLKVNHHLAACHLKDVLLDYGPMCAYWAFPLERFDGLTADVHTNGSNIEVSMLRNFFQTDRAINVVMKDKAFVSSLSTMLNPLYNNDSHHRIHLPSTIDYAHLLTQSNYKTLNEKPVDNEFSAGRPYLLRILDYQYINITSEMPDCTLSLNSAQVHDYLRNDFLIPCIPTTTLKTINCLEPNKRTGRLPYMHAMTALQQYYKYRYHPLKQEYFTHTLHLFHRMTIFGDQFGSAVSRGERSSYITAFKRIIPDVQHPGDFHFELQIASIQYFFKHSAHLHPNITMSNTYAYVHWYERVNVGERHKRARLTPEQQLLFEYETEFDKLLTPIYVKTETIDYTVNNREFELYHNIIPISHIANRCMMVPEPIAKANEYIVIPLERKLQG